MEKPMRRKFIGFKLHTRKYYFSANHTDGIIFSIYSFTHLVPRQTLQETTQTLALDTHYEKAYLWLKLNEARAGRARPKWSVRQVLPVPLSERGEQGLSEVLDRSSQCHCQTGIKSEDLSPRTQSNIQNSLTSFR